FVYDETKKHLKANKQHMKKWANRKKKEAPIYHNSQLVILNTKNIKTKQPAKKLDKKIFGPF
ncbi:hypothetical protein M426DRAFT_63465, partial [Hypoxylon sp. CI-4A]